MSDIDPTVRLIVCGNIDRGDDGAAACAATSLLGGMTEEQRRHLDVRRNGQLDLDDVIAAGPDYPLIIIDTAVGVAPGRVVTVSFDQLLENPRGPAPASSHALPIDQVLGVARQLADGRIDGLFVGIGGEDFGFGHSLSAPVRAALPTFVEAIRVAAGGMAHVP